MTSFEPPCHNYTQIIVFLNSHHFGKCAHLIFQYIIGYNISWRPHDSPSENLGVVTPRLNPLGSTPKTNQNYPNQFAKFIKYMMLQQIRPNSTRYLLLSIFFGMLLSIPDHVYIIMVKEFAKH